MSRLFLVLVAAGAVLAMSAAPVAAHTELSESTPREGSVIRTLPDRLALTFSGDLATDGISISVIGPDGVDLVEGPYRFAAREVSVALESGAQPVGGAYEVTWKVTSIDGHAIDGSYAFRLKAPASAPAAQPSVDPASASTSQSPLEPGANSEQAAEDPEDSDDTSVPVWAFMIGGVVLIALIISGIFLVRRRAR